MKGATDVHAATPWDNRWHVEDRAQEIQARRHEARSESQGQEGCRSSSEGGRCSDKAGYFRDPTGRDENQDFRRNCDTEGTGE